MNKKCKYCKDGDLVLKQGVYSEFYGCSNWPECAGIERIPQYKNELEEKANKLLGEKPL